MLRIAAALALLLVTCVANAWASGAYASSHIFITNGVSKDDQQSGSVDAKSELQDIYEGAEAHAFGNASVFPLPQLRAYAYGKSSHVSTPDGDNFYAATASAGCSGSDNLRSDNSHIVDPDFLKLNPYIYFAHSVKGSLTNKNRASFVVQFYSFAQGQLVSSTKEFIGPKFVQDGIIIRIPANFFAVNEDVTYSIGLSVDGGAVTDENGNYIGDGTTNFAATAELLYYYIADSGGNPIPGAEKVSIVGDNGPYKKIDPPAKLQNISTRMQVRTGNDVLIGGFIVAGTEPKKVLVRGLGPSLPVNGALADPTLELHDASSVLASNDNWKDNQRSEIEATGIPPSNDAESAIVQTLPANNSAYTTVLAGKSNGTGVGLVEIYDVGSLADSRLVNISTRGFVDTADNVMIGGLILGPSGTSAVTVLVRGIGPSLSTAGVANALQDPLLELHDSNGVTIASNDNWKETQEQAIRDTTIPPSDDSESAIVQTVASGSYTAVLRGKNSTTGVGLVEIYNLQ